MRLFDYYSNPSEPEKRIVTDQDTLRIYIGLLGFFLPVILLLWLYFDSQISRPISSISHYYYTRANSAFVITLGILAVVLFAYKGKRLVDFWLSTTASLCAFLVILLPTNIGFPSIDKIPAYYITYIGENELRGWIHFIAAGIFLLSLAIMSFFRFPKDDSSDEQPKPLDQFMYRICGVVMVVALFAIFLGVNGILLPKALFSEKNSTGIFWGEAVAVWAFGYSWLLKAGFFTKFFGYFANGLSAIKLFIKSVPKPS